MTTSRLWLKFRFASDVHVHVHVHVHEQLLKHWVNNVWVFFRVILLLVSLLIKMNRAYPPPEQEYLCVIRVLLVMVHAMTWLMWLVSTINLNMQRIERIDRRARRLFTKTGGTGPNIGSILQVFQTMHKWRNNRRIQKTRQCRHMTFFRTIPLHVCCVNVAVKLHGINMVPPQQTEQGPNCTCFSIADV